MRNAAVGTEPTSSSSSTAHEYESNTTNGIHMQRTSQSVNMGHENGLDGDKENQVTVDVINKNDDDPNGVLTPNTPDTPQTPKDCEAPEDLRQSICHPTINKWRVLGTTCVSMLMCLNDSAPGALLPYIEKTYNIGYAVVSLLFIFCALGFLVAAPFTHAVTSRFGRSYTMIGCVTLMIIAYVLLICQLPYPVMVFAFFLNGLGTSICSSISNVFNANLSNGSVALSIYHGVYGLGGVIGPLAATAIASHGAKWSYYYCISLLFGVINMCLTVFVFKGYEKEAHAKVFMSLERTDSGRETQSSKRDVILYAFKKRTTWLGAIFNFAYQGSEVAISGWIVSFLHAYRGGDLSKVGYVSSGFWAGIAVGRFFLVQVGHKIGVKYSVFGCTVASFGFQLVVWFVPSIIGDAVAAAIIGVLLGPIYPCSATTYVILLPQSLQFCSFGFISAMGSVGGAVAPFIVGLLSQRFGTVVLHPVNLVLYVVMVVTWLCLPRLPKEEKGKGATEEAQGSEATLSGVPETAERRKTQV